MNTKPQIQQPIPFPLDESREDVLTLRDGAELEAASGSESAEQWLHRFQVWIDSLPSRPVAFDDDRATIYADRGE